MNIKIWQEPFDSIFYADVNGKTDKYLASDTLEILLDSIKNIVLEKLKEPE